MKLQLKKVGQDTNTFDVSSGRINIGREQSNDLVLNDPTVSGFHAAIFYENSICTIVDLGSSNGTLLNGTPLSGKTVLNLSDTISFGNQRFQLINPDGPKNNKTQLLNAVQEPERSNANPRKSVGQLVLKKGQGPEVIELDRTITIGRSTENDIVISDTMISGRHAGLAVSDTGVEVYDADSTNGTFVNGKRISQGETGIYDGDIIAFDEVTYKAELPSHPRPQESIAKTSVRQVISESAEETSTVASTQIKETQAAKQTFTEPKVAVEPEKKSQAEIQAARTLPTNDVPAELKSTASKPAPMSEKPTTTPEVKSVSKKPATTGTNDKIAKKTDNEESSDSVDQNKTNVQQAAVNSNYKPSTFAPPPPPSPQSKQAKNQIDESADSGQTGLKWLLTSYEGRIKRATFWASILSLLVVFLLLQFLLAVMVYGNMETGMQAMQLARSMQFSSLSPAFNIGYITLSLAALFFTSAIYTKRLHDRGRTGWIALLIFVPHITAFLVLSTGQLAFGFVNVIISLYLLIELGCLKGQLHDNQYGKSPYAQVVIGK